MEPIRANTFELEGTIPGQPVQQQPRRPSEAGKDPQTILKERAEKSRDPAVLVEIPKTPVAMEYETAQHVGDKTAFEPRFEDEKVVGELRK